MTQAIIKHVGIHGAQLDILRREIRLDIADDRLLGEKDYFRLVELTENIDELINKLRRRNGDHKSSGLSVGQSAPVGDSRMKRNRDEDGTGFPTDTRNYTWQQCIDCITQTSDAKWRRIGDDLPSFLRNHSRVTPKVHLWHCSIRLISVL